ncbi:MAG: hypothetical protein D6674_06725 [Acidobacteria bacterium]|jgi:stage V sporulation protein G|nr:MAG: hypothetical protein D6674_06725 [Acidobacteriota bacterium]
MNVELISFYPFEVSNRRPRLLGYADVNLDGKIIIRGIRLFESKHGGYFISMPEFYQTERDVVEVKDREILEKIRRLIVDYYKENLRE